jgi:hypothetical protein
MDERGVATGNASKGQLANAYRREGATLATLQLTLQQINVNYNRTHPLKPPAVQVFVWTAP